MEAHDAMAAESSCLPDKKAYSVLLQGCLDANALEQAMHVVRCAYRLPTRGKAGGRTHQGRFVPGVEAGLLSELVARLRLGDVAQQEEAQSLTVDLDMHHQLDVDAVPAAATRAGKGGEAR